MISSRIARQLRKRSALAAFACAEASGTPAGAAQEYAQNSRLKMRMLGSALLLIACHCARLGRLHCRPAPVSLPEQPQSHPHRYSLRTPFLALAQHASQPKSAKAKEALRPP